ncbi:MAG: antitermination protein [Sodalis sp. (in: enterobacteria)]|uniref:transcriptional antitermination N peptide n=1 Tax=Sodalis sp. (in: enterobacteria) TaxID=1898979 RepID=UPI003F2B1FE8
MTTIVHGKTVRPITHASGRLKDRRKAEAVQRELVASRIDKVLGLKPEKRKTLTRIELACKRKPALSLDLSTPSQYQEQIALSAQKHMKARYPHCGSFVAFKEGSCCLENVALFQAGYRKQAGTFAAR